MQSNWVITPTIMVLVFHRFVVALPKEVEFVSLAALMGFSVDSLLQWLGVFDFGSVLAPIWLLCLWLVFATTINHALSWFRDKLWLAALVGGVSGASTYAVAVFKFNAATTSFSMLHLLMILAAVWALFFPALLWLSNKMVPRSLS